MLATKAPQLANQKQLSSTQSHIYSQKTPFNQSLLYQYLAPMLMKNSVTPNDAGCQNIIADNLQALGFECQHFVECGVSNLIAKVGNGTTRIAFAGHTDVVPTGNLNHWSSAPFKPTLKSGKLYARGVADMKGGIAAMMSAFAKTYHQLNLDDFSFYFLVTSDEEGEADCGTIKIMEWLKRANELPQMCIVGEPTANKASGDTIKIGRRGAISGQVHITGKQGHVAYPQFANNAAHMAAEFAFKLSQLPWDEGSNDFPGSSLQVTHINTGDWTDNIIPGESQVSFNIRYSHKYSELSVKHKVMRVLESLAYPQYDINVTWQRPCHPYYTRSDQSNQVQLVNIAEQAVFDVCQTFPKLSTSGGTSDGRFIANTGCQVIELGVPNHSIHQVNEHVAVADLLQLEAIYKKLLINLMAKK